MKINCLLILSALLLIGCEKSYSLQNETLPKAKRSFQTKLLNKIKIGNEVQTPPAKLFKIVQYKSSVGYLSSYVSVPKEYNKRYPAIIWIVGGFSNSIGPTAWIPRPPENDQSARAFRNEGIIMMFPSLRGGNKNPGYIEGLYGEVDDILSAYDYLAEQNYVDSDRIYLGGHSTGGTLALLVAESTDKFRAIFALGPAADIRGYGEKYFHFDISNPMEWRLRSPKYYLQSIVTPTYVFEGTLGNIRSLRDMRDSTRNQNIKFYEIQGGNHFNIIAPITKILAEKIILNQASNENISFLEYELVIKVE